MSRTTMAIAESDILLSSEVKKYIEGEYHDIIVRSLLETGEDAVSYAGTSNPDILITDLAFPGMADMEVIRAIKGRCENVRLVILTDIESFDYAREAIDLEVDAYVLKKDWRTELSLAINRILGDMALETARGRGAESLRAHFFSEETRNIQVESNSIENINHKYCTNFRKGLFKVFQIKLDFDSDPESFFNKTSRIFQDLRNIVIQDFKDVAYEIIANEKFDGSFFLLNYDKSLDPTIDDILRNRIMPKFSAYCTRFFNLHVTMGVGFSANTVDRIYPSQKSAASANWLRMAHGLDKVYYWDDYSYVCAQTDLEKIESYKNAVYTAFVLLDDNAATENIDALFALPEETMCLSEFKVAVTNIRQSFFDLYAHILYSKYDTDELIQKISYLLHMCQTFAEYGDTLKKIFGELIQEAIDLGAKPKSSYIKKAIKYIERNCSGDLSLTVLANELNISPVYLSSLFTKEVGRSYIQYVNEYRIQTAKKLLHETELSISEVCENVGYSEARYFSRIFKKLTGYKPSEFRKAAKIMR